MQNLVSKNPILRFKLGRKIVKMLHGTPGKSSNEKFADWLSSIGPKIFSVKPTGGGLLGWINGTSSNLLSVLTNTLNNTLNNTSSRKVTTVSPDKITNSRDAMKYMYYSLLNNPPAELKLGQSSTVKPATTGTKVVAKQPASYLFGKMGGWNKSMKNNITDEESLRMLKEMGMENYSAGLVLDEINKLFGTNAVKRDDRWGNLSRAGLRSLYENWKLQNNNSSIDLPSKTLNSIAVNQEPITPEQQTEQAIINNNFKTIENNGQKYFARTGNYNRSQLRDYMRLMGLNPYDFKGSERKALRLWLNGLSNDNSLLTGRLRDLFVTPYGYKQGGQLVSRNPVKRFKSNFRLVAQ